MEMEKNSQGIEQEEIQKREELTAAEKTKELLELEDLKYAKEMAEINLKRKNIAPGLIQVKHNIKRIHQELKTLDVLKWRALKKERGY